MPRALSSIRRAAAFTLTELLIAVGVLVVVITAAAKIFSASSKVAAVAEANADLIQTATAIESQIRADFSNIPKNSFLVIQQVEVNAFGQAQNPVVDPSLGAAEIRADQIAFFTRGSRQTTQYTGSQESNSNNGVATTWTAESAIARVYYGHGVTAPALPLGTDIFSYDTGAPVVPWKGGAVELVRSSDGLAQGTRIIASSKAGNWPLVRLATLMASDGLPTTVDSAGNATTTTLGRFGSTQPNSSVSLFAWHSYPIAPNPIRLNPLATKYPSTYSALWTSGRVDVVKWQPDDLYSQTAFQSDAQQAITGIPFIRPQLTSPWGGSSVRLRMIQTLAAWSTKATGSPTGGQSGLYLAYPRVEKAAPSSAKADVMLTAPVLAPNCSSFKVEWTWGHGVGSSFRGGSSSNPPQGGEAIGMFIRTGTPVPAQPWFGLDPLGAASVGASAVRPVSNGPNFLDNGSVGDWGAIGVPLVVGNSQADLVCSVEGPINRDGDALVVNRPVWRCGTEQDSKRVYQAVFGLNQDDASNVNPFSGQRGPYTPLPSAIRITVRLHDPLNRIEGGRDFQFIVDLPKR